MKAIVTGMIATYPVGGVVWDYAQYLVGLERLGFEVFYLEDTGRETYNPLKGEYGEDCSYGAEFLKASLAKLSPTLATRWRFRNMDGKTVGIDDRTFSDVLRGAELFLNVSGGTLLRDEYLACKRKVLIDSDPGWNHFQNFPRWDASPNWQSSHGYRAHDFFFTYAERMGRPDCLLPDCGLAWKPTRPLVLMDCWHAAPPGEKWTTVMTWKNFSETIQYKGVTYGTKEMEFGKVEQLPARILHGGTKLEIAVGGNEAPRESWRSLGWDVVESQDISRTADDYRSYIQNSRGEFSVAKNVYVATRCGWFSCRSVCYLAAGLPVVVQDTGFSEFIPTGEGLFAFSDLDEAVSGIEAVEKDYRRHQRAARELARTYFASDVVLRDLLTGIGL